MTFSEVGVHIDLYHEARLPRFAPHLPRRKDVLDISAEKAFRIIHRSITRSNAPEFRCAAGTVWDGAGWPTGLPRGRMAHGGGRPPRRRQAAHAPFGSAGAESILHGEARLSPSGATKPPVRVRAAVPRQRRLVRRFRVRAPRAESASKTRYDESAPRYMDTRFDAGSPRKEASATSRIRRLGFGIHRATSRRCAMSSASSTSRAGPGGA